jgi:hypothetical protein
MRLTRFALACALVALPSAAGAGEELTFAGLPWGAERALVTERLTAEGFSLRDSDAGGNLVFLGRVHDQAAIVMAWMARGQLVKVSVRLITSGDEAPQVYEKTRQQLVESFGEPVKDAEGNAAPAAFWRRGQSDAYVKISAELTVDISYESAAWRAEFERLTKRTSGGGL